MPDSAIRYHCRHIHLTGHRCGSPALRGENFCYYHHTTRPPVPSSAVLARRPSFEISALDDRATLQLAIAEVLNRLAAGTLDPKRAGLLLYGLQIAATNLPPHRHTRPSAETVDELEHDEQDQPLAPTQEFENTPREKTLEEVLNEKWERDKQIDEEDRLAHEALFPSVILPGIQGTAELHELPASTYRPKFESRTNHLQAVTFGL